MTKVESAFGESWISKCQRILGNDYHEYQPDHLENITTSKQVFDELYPLYDLKAYIIKSNDDLRQEMCTLQIVSLFQEIFNDLGLTRYLYLHMYHIVATSNNTGIVEVISNAISLDVLKKSNGFISLSNYFKVTYNTSNEKLYQAKCNFASSLAGYSLLCYILQIKDRHNGNILLDMYGHLIHIDFGFILSIAPGKLGIPGILD